VLTEELIGEELHRSYGGINKVIKEVVQSSCRVNWGFVVKEGIR